MTLTRKILASLAGALMLLGGVFWGVSAQAATVPPHTPPGAVVHMYNTSDHQQWYKLQNVDPFTGRYGYLPLGNGLISHVKWTSVNSTTVNGTGKWDYGFMGLCVNGPVIMTLKGSGYKYTRISVALTEDWVTNTHGTTACPPDGHGASHSVAINFLAKNDPTLNLTHF